MYSYLTHKLKPSLNAQESPDEETVVNKLGVKIYDKIISIKHRRMREILVQIITKTITISL